MNWQEKRNKEIKEFIFDIVAILLLCVLFEFIILTL